MWSEIPGHTKRIFLMLYLQQVKTELTYDAEILHMVGIYRNNKLSQLFQAV